MIVSRLRRRVGAVVAAGAVAFGLAGCSNTVSDAATITYHDASGSHTIHVTRSDFTKQLGELVGSARFQSLLKSGNVAMGGDQKNTTSTNLSGGYLSQLVEQSAIDAEFTELKLSFSTADRNKAVDETKSQFALQSEIGQDAQGTARFLGPGAVYLSFPKSLQNVLVERRARRDALSKYYADLTPAKTQALYDEFASTICPSGRLVAQILVKDLTTASAIVDQLRAGASFTDLAKTKSTDASGKTGGSVGCLRRGAFVKEFEAAAYAAQFDVPTAPVKSQFGYHVILVTRPTFAALQGELTQVLQQQPLVAQSLRMQEMKVWISPQYGVGGLAVDSQGGLGYRINPPAVPSVRVCRQKSFPCSTTTTLSTSTTVPPGG